MNWQTSAQIRYSLEANETPSWRAYHVTKTGKTGVERSTHYAARYLGDDMDASLDAFDRFVNSVGTGSYVIIAATTPQDTSGAYEYHLRISPTGVAGIGSVQHAPVKDNSPDLSAIMERMDAMMQENYRLKEHIRQTELAEKDKAIQAQITALREELKERDELTAKYAPYAKVAVDAAIGWLEQKGYVEKFLGPATAAPISGFDTEEDENMTEENTELDDNINHYVAQIYSRSGAQIMHDALKRLTKLQPDKQKKLLKALADASDSSIDKLLMFI